MKRVLVLLACLCSLPGQASAAAEPSTVTGAVNVLDEQAEHDRIFAAVREAVVQRDFATLSHMEDEFRNTRVRMPAGEWKLAVFHAGVQGYLAQGLEPAAECQFKKRDLVKAWGAAFPKNPAPTITEAALLLAQAWCVRGTGYAAEVKTDAWPAFHDHVAEASEVLERGRKVASVDPEFYAVKLRTLRAQGAEKPEI